TLRQYKHILHIVLLLTTLFFFSFLIFHLILHFSFFFFFNDPATTEIYTLSLHDALPISASARTCTAGRTKRSMTSARSRDGPLLDRKSTRLNSSHVAISYAVFCLKKKKKIKKKRKT